MPPFDAEKFEEKYRHYLDELDQAYRNAFDYMNEQYDSGLVHVIDQKILDSSEPRYEGNAEFRIELPDAPMERLQSDSVDEEQFETVLSAYVERLEAELRAVFDLESRD